jgi:L-ribulose-5-phosphate 4-epimerase
MVSVDALRQDVLAANLALAAHGLVALTWGNVSGIDRSTGRVAIKPSGVPYETMTAADIVVVDLDGAVIVGNRRPSTDMPTHLELYRAFDDVGGIAHTHSTWAAAWAQAQRSIPILGTTHADLCAHPIPVTRALRKDEIEADYERATGTAVIEAVADLDPLELPGVLVRSHGPFCWARGPEAAVETAVTLEEVARIALLTITLEPDPEPLDAALREKHHARKHGPSAYYGQR